MSRFDSVKNKVGKGASALEKLKDKSPLKGKLGAPGALKEKLDERTKICPVCDEPIHLLTEKAHAARCFGCGEVCHKQCLVDFLDYDSYQEGRIDDFQRFCATCAATATERYSDDMMCKTCGASLFLNHSAVRCEKCDKIGHSKCFSSNAAAIAPDLPWIYPYIYENESHQHLCDGCVADLKQTISDIKASKEPLILNTASWVGKYKVVKEIKSVETETFQVEEDALEQLSRYCRQLDGTGVIIKHYYREDDGIRIRGVVVKFAEIMKTGAQMREDVIWKIATSRDKTVYFYSTGDIWKIGKPDCLIELTDMKSLEMLHYIISNAGNSLTASNVHLLGKMPDLPTHKPEEISDSYFDDDDEVVKDWSYLDGITKKIETANRDQLRAYCEQLKKAIKEDDNTDQNVKLLKNKLWEVNFRLKGYDPDAPEDPNRSAVKKSIGRAIDKIRQREKESYGTELIGKHLETHIKTGSSIKYDPPAHETFDWVFFATELPEPNS